MKYFEIVLEERNGEQEYTHRVVVKEKDIISAKKRAKKIARTWYQDCVSKNSNTYYFSCSMAIAVKIESVQETNPKSFFQKHIM